MGGAKEVVKRQRRLPVQLTDDELREAGASLSASLTECKELATKKKKWTALWKDDYDDAQSNVETYRDMIETHTEDRLVDCDVTFDYAADRMTVVRVDTGEIVEDRSIADDERQTELADAEDGDT